LTPFVDDAEGRSHEGSDANRPVIEINRKKRRTVPLPGPHEALISPRNTGRGSPKARREEVSKRFSGKIPALPQATKRFCQPNLAGPADTSTIKVSDGGGQQALESANSRSPPPFAPPKS
jgi:hypothetical protein